MLLQHEGCTICSYFHLFIYLQDFKLSLVELTDRKISASPTASIPLMSLNYIKSVNGISKLQRLITLEMLKRVMSLVTQLQIITLSKF